MKTTGQWVLEVISETTRRRCEQTAEVTGLRVGQWVERALDEALKEDSGAMDREHFRDILRDLTGQLRIYHNHKENMAWAAVAGFMVTSIGISSFAFKASLPAAVDWMLFCIIVVAYLLTLFFARVQLNAKNAASDQIGACTQLLFDLGNRTLTADDIAFPENKGAPAILLKETRVYGTIRRNGRQGMRDALRYLVTTVIGERSPLALAKAWRSGLVDHEKQEIILTAGMTLTAIITAVGVMLPAATPS